jgi:transglutaminase-like putative cysteine protease
VKYHVTHTTDYQYGDVVPLCHNLLHLRPRDTWRQTCAWNEIEVRPQPAVARERVDFFGNYVTWLSIQEPHGRLTVTSTSEVDVSPLRLPDGFDGGPWDAVPKQIATRRDDYSLEAMQFTFESPYVPRHESLVTYARPSFAPGRPMLDAVTELTDRIYHDFTFDSNVTTVGTPVLEVLLHRHGVCQDFAHLQVACLRSLGLAARYVSGYLVTKPPPGRPRLVGSDASHAWVSVHFPDFGWLDFDPTNGCLPSDQHVTVGWARDYDDVSPVRGVIIGGQRHYLRVGVDVEPIVELPDDATTTDALPTTVPAGEASG